jgi:hypothetical protein
MSQGSDPQAQLEGGCLCGGIRYRVAREAVLCVYCCHCRDCQRLSSSAFAVSMVLPAAAFALLRGAPRSIVRRANSGRDIFGFFCGDCGTRLFDRFIEQDQVMVVKAGTLDDTAGLRPVAQFWTERKQAWVTLPQDQLVETRQPDGFEEVIALYQDQARRDIGG